MIPEQVYLLFYEDKHGNEIDVYGDEKALETAQCAMMEDPESQFAATVEITAQQYDDVTKRVYDDNIADAWDMFVEICRESEVYLRVEVRTVTYSGGVGISTGRFSSSEPNISNVPQPDAPKSMFREQPDKGDGKKRYTKTICIDFDGVLHMYTSKWAGADQILDGPVEGAIEWLIRMVHDERFQVCIYSSRSKDPGGVEAMQEWLLTHLAAFYDIPAKDDEPDWVTMVPREILEVLEFPTQKPAAVMTIDDRAYRFEGRFPSLDWLDRFRPWNKRHPERDAAEYEGQSERDLELAEEVLDCISNCLVRYEGRAPGYLAGGGNYYFEPSTRTYLAGMFREARQEKKEE